MLEKTSKTEFIRAGLSRYADARETVDYFETSITEAIVAAFEMERTWRNFQPNKDASGNLQWGKATGSVDRFIQGFLAGTVPNRTKDKIWIYLGLYWKPVRRPAAHVVAATAAFVERGGPVPLLDVPNRNKQVTIGPLNKKNERRLLLEPREDFEPIEDFALLLDSLDEAMGAIDAVDH